jgi:hypothetical protein
MKPLATCCFVLLATTALPVLPVVAGDPLHAGPQRRAGFSVSGRPVSLNAKDANAIQLAKSKNVQIFYPSLVPPRFSLSSVTVEDLSSKDNRYPDYKLEFTDKQKQSFAIESAYEGIGDGPDGDRVLQGKSKVFGAFRIDVLKPGSEGNCTKQVYYISSWMPDQPRIQSEKNGDKVAVGRYHHFLGTGITDKEAIAIVESLAELK